MKKFLTIDESNKLFELGIPEQYASYLYCEDSRFDTISMEMLTYIGYWNKKDRCTIFGDDKPVFSAGDLCNIVTEYLGVNINTVLEEEKFNYYSGESVNTDEFIDYLYNYIVKTFVHHE